MSFTEYLKINGELLPFPDSYDLSLSSVESDSGGETEAGTIQRDVVRHGVVDISVHLDVGGEYEEVPMGIFEISEANRSIKTLEIKAYDCMLNFEKNFRNKLSSGTPYDFLSLACENCHVPFAHTRADIEKMPNGKYLYGIYIENDIESWRDLIFYVAQVLGCYCQINRQGKLELRKYGNNPIMRITDKQRFSSSFSDFITRYTAVNSTNQKTATAEYYAATPDDGLTMNLGVNPLLQFGLKDTRERIIRNILNDISKVRYVPFDSETIGNPALDIGDVISFSGGQADETQIAAITGMTVKINGKTSLKCVGKNPRLSQAKSKNDKNIAGLLNSVEVGKITVHSYMNSSPFTVGENDTEVVSMEFASQDDTDAEFHGSILIDITADSIQKTATVKVDDKDIVMSWNEDGRVTLKVTYVINDNVMNTYYPIETWYSGKHILNLYYPISKLEANAYNTFYVRLSVTGGTAFIDRMQALCTITGQGLSAGNAWDGRLSFEEKFTLVPSLGLVSVRETNEIVVPYTEVPKPIGLTDTFIPARLGKLTTLHFIAEPQMNPVIVTETIELADREEMTFNHFFVKTVDTFEFQTNYSFASFEVPIDEGRIFALVGVANLIDVQVIQTGSILRTAVVFFYLSNEGVSLLENAAHLGLPIPKKLKAVLEQLHDKHNKEDDKHD